MDLKFYIKNMNLPQPLVNVSLHIGATHIHKHSLGFYCMVQYDTENGLTNMLLNMLLEHTVGSLAFAFVLCSLSLTPWLDSTHYTEQMRWPSK